MHDPEPCTCGECRDLDRAFPKEGWQAKLPLNADAAATPATVMAALRRARLLPSTEAALQTSIETTLAGAGILAEREVRLAPGERIDFLVAGGIGIEAKARCQPRAIFRQLERYAKREQITALILVTGTACGLPATIGGKPAFFVSVGRTAL